MMISSKNLLSAWRAFYCIGVAGIALQQLYYGEFRPALILQWPAWLPLMAFFTDLTSAALIFLCFLIILNRSGRTWALVLAILFMFLFLAFQVPFMLFVYTEPLEIGAWTNPLKTLAISGGALVVAGSFQDENKNTLVQKFFSPFIPLGKFFFSFMLIIFGIEHLVYTAFVATLVPSWIPWPVFWTYVAAIALIGGGMAIMFNIKRRTVAKLAGIMLFIWFLILHIPRAIEYPDVLKGNELTSVFQALAFSAVAFLIAMEDARFKVNLIQN
jgi:uncharacterized membrane protein